MSTLEHEVEDNEVNGINPLPNPYGFVWSHDDKGMISMARAGDTKLDPTPYAPKGKKEEFIPREEFYRNAA